MGILLQIIGGIVLTLIVLGVIAFLYLRWQVKRFQREMEGIIPEAMAPMPARLHMTAAPEAGWREADVAAAAAELEMQGFRRIGAFQANELPSIRIFAMASEERRAYAVIYHALPLGTWADLVTRFEDGTTMTFTNAKTGFEMDARPGTKSVYAPGVPISELYSRYESEIPDAPKQAADPAQFVAYFEDYYAKTMEWRAQRGYSKEEVRRVALEMGEEYEGYIDETYEHMNDQVIPGLEETIIERYLEESNVSAKDWERQRDRVLVVHDRMDSDDLHDALCDFLDEEMDELDEVIEAGEVFSPRGKMDEVNATLPEAKRFQKVGHVTTPVPADIYIAPFVGAV